MVFCHDSSFHNGRAFGARVQAPSAPGFKGFRRFKGKVLKMDRPAAGGFLSLTGPLAPRVADCRSAAMLIKSALRIYLSVSYGMISILLIGSLRSPPPIRVAPDFPLFREQNKTPRNTLFINGSTVSTGYSATVEVLHRTSTVGRSKAPRLPIKALSFCRPTELRRWQRNWIHRGVPRPANPVTCFPTGKGVVPTTKGGMHFLERSEAGLFSSGEARLSGFRRQRRPKNWRPPRAPTSPAQRYFITSEGGALNLPVRRQPFTGRTLAAQGRQARRLPQPSPAGRQPSGLQLPADSPQKPIISNDTHSKKAP